MSNILYINKRAFRIFKTKEFDKWFEKSSNTEKSSVMARLAMIKDNGHFGDSKFLDTNLYELRWKNGRRIYYCFKDDTLILLLIGGNKNDQKQDIKRAKGIKEKYSGTY